MIFEIAGGRIFVFIYLSNFLLSFLGKGTKVTSILKIITVSTEHLSNYNVSKNTGSNIDATLRYKFRGTLLKWYHVSFETRQYLLEYIRNIVGALYVSRIVIILMTQKKVIVRTLVLLLNACVGSIYYSSCSSITVCICVLDSKISKK